MKKIFTLLFSIGTMTTVFAQGGYSNRDGRDQSRDVILGNDRATVYKDDNVWAGKDNRSYEIDNRRKEEEIRKVNKDYEFQIAAVKRNRYMTTKEKNRQVQRLEKEKNQKIAEINRKYAKTVSYNDRNKRF